MSIFPSLAGFFGPGRQYLVSVGCQTVEPNGSSNNKPFEVASWIEMKEEGIRDTTH